MAPARISGTGSAVLRVQRTVAADDARGGRRMSGGLGWAVHHRRWYVLAAAALALSAAVVGGSGVFAHLAGSGFADPASESARAQDLADDHLPPDGADVVAIYTSAAGTVDEPAFRGAVEGALARLPAEPVTGIETPWSTGSTDLVSTDRRSVAVLLRLRGADERARRTTYREVEGPLTHPPAGLRVAVGGSVPLSVDINARVERDVTRAELVTLPLLLLLLVILLRGVIAACVPVLVGVLVITGALAVLRALTAVTDVSVFAVNVVTMLGLGLAVDYALLMITRFREELARGRDVVDAVRNTVTTSGRTVLVSGLIIAGTLASLLLFPQV